MENNTVNPLSPVPSRKHTANRPRLTARHQEDSNAKFKTFITHWFKNLAVFFKQRANWSLVVFIGAVFFNFIVNLTNAITALNAFLLSIIAVMIAGYLFPHPAKTDTSTQE